MVTPVSRDHFESYQEALEKALGQLFGRHKAEIKALTDRISTLETRIATFASIEERLAALEAKIAAGAPCLIEPDRAPVLVLEHNEWSEDDVSN